MLLQRQRGHGGGGRQRLRGQERHGGRRRGRLRCLGVGVLQDLLGRFGLAPVGVVHQVHPATAAAGRPRPLHGRGACGRGDRREVGIQLGLLAVEAGGAGGRRLAAVGGGRVGEALDLEGAGRVDQGSEVLLQSEK